MTRSTASTRSGATRATRRSSPRGTGPEGGAPIGGVNAGEGGPSDGGVVNVPDNPTGVWVNDYTIQPENGGLSVFAHEFAHDLGLPDLYDTSGNTGGAENSVGFWSLMAQSRGTLPGDAGIGDRPMPMGAWDKFPLGWLDYDVDPCRPLGRRTRSVRTSPRTPPRSTTARRAAARQEGHLRHRCAVRRVRRRGTSTATRATTSTTR